MKTLDPGCTIEAARDEFVSYIPRIRDRETVALADAYMRIAAGDVYCENDIPSFDRSAMDGYAVRSEDIKDASENAPVTLSVAGILYAGDHKEIICTPGSAVRVMTGAYIPAGYDCVVMQEDTDRGSSRVKIYKAVGRYVNYSFAGEQLKHGEAVVKRGDRLDRVALFRLASAGWDSVEVVRRAWVTIVTTGSELVSPGQPLPPGKIYDAVSALLSASVREAGFLAETVHAADTEQEIKDALRAGGKSDLIITTGGVSVGEKDLLPKLMEELGAVKVFARADIQPGTPTAGYILDGKPVLCLSGNPFAALANFDWYFPHIACALTGCAAYIKKIFTARLDDDYDKGNRHRRMVRAYYEQGSVRLPVKTHFASSLEGMAECNCYIILPAGAKVSRGDMVEVLML